MNSESARYNSYNLDHLGLIAGMVDELGLPELIDTLIKQDHDQRQVSVGVCVKAMILNGLGFVNRALYLMPQFFKDKPIERLLGKGIEAEHLNDDTLGRALDAIYTYDAEKLYSQLAAQSVKRLGLSCQIGHIDSTSFHVDGIYNSDQHEVEEGVIRITQGYSRDHRPDLNQVILQLISEHLQEGVGFKGKGRPGKDCKPAIIGYRIEAGVASVLETRQRKIQQKSGFIIASNQLDETQLSHETMLDHYTPGQQKVERGFRFLKDPWFMANTLFLKSPKRIMALMMIMTLCLLVYGALEYRIRQKLEQQKQSFPNQLGKKTEKPTARWVFQFFTGIHLLVCDNVRSIVLNCNAYHHQLLNLLGDRYVLLYANSE